MRSKAGSGKQFRPGDYKIIDDLTGMVIYASEARERWDHAMVHSDLWESRHPQDFLKSVREANITWGRPEPEDTFGQTGPEDL